MSEFKLHHLVVELIGLLGSSSAPEKHVEKLQKEGIPTSASALTIVASQSSVRNLAKNSPVPELFLQKYEELKAKKVDLLGLFIQVLELISEDKELKSYLTKEAAALTSISTKNAAITTEDLPQICKNVIKAAVEGEKKLNKQVCAISKKIEPSVIKHNWVHERPRITWDFYNELNVMPCQKVVPIVSQESILLWDILYCLKGIDGIYIVSEPLTSPYAMKTFNISPDVCISYKQLTQQILPLASHYSMTARFVEEKVLPEDGQVNHALREAIKTLLKDYLLFVVQLEMEHVRGKLNLQKLWFYIQPTMIAMTILFQITSTICKANAKGGKVLSLLHEQANNISGEAKFRELCLFLIQAASVPYMQMLEKWVYKGVICDPYEEFFVEDNELIHREELPIDYSADYWEKRYTMRSERTPTFLNEQAQTILRTGKYFNVIRQCGKTVQWGKQEPLIYQQQGQKYITAIDRAYSEAAKTLLEVLIHENDLMGRLRSLKNYFLLAQGDFVVQFMNLCETELNKNMYDIVIHRLASLLEVALRMSTADSDPYKDDLKPELLPYDLQFQMFRILSIQTREEKEYSFQTDKVLTGLDAFVFNYDVKWPVSLILNRKAIACYQMLFRHLFYCKYIERRLCRVWVSNKIAKTFTHNVAMSYRQAFSLRQRMLDCIQHLAYYMMVEVIEPNWLTFINKMNKVSNVDDVLSVHQDLQDSYLKECMLTDPDLLGCITGICAACLEFCNFMEDEDGDTSKENAASFEETIISLDEKFTQVLIRLLDRICNLGYDNNNEKLLNVFCRLQKSRMETKNVRVRGLRNPVYPIKEPRRYFFQKGKIKVDIKNMGMTQRPWTPTKRRGPIAAEYNSPGPACVTLPPLIGKIVPDSKRGRAPAFSFGSRHATKNDSPGPGPGQYNVFGLSAKGKDAAPASSLHSRTKFTKQEITPAPGDYNPEKAEKIILDHSPKYSFGIKTQTEKISCTPAPNDYCTEKVNIDKSPEYSFGLKSVLDKPSDIPAPGTYHPEKVRLDNTPQYSFGVRPPLVKPNDNPAPGLYYPEKVNLDKGPQYSLTGKGRVEKPDNIPAPGTYYPENVKLDKTPQFTFGLRTPLEKINDTPAPGTYAPEKVNLDKAPQYTFGLKTFLDKPNTNPAPGDYCPEKINLNKGPEYSLSGKGLSEKPNDIPAPGTYRPEKVNLNKGPQYSLYGKGISEKPNNNPAPGTYSPEKINLDKGPQFSLSGKGLPRKFNENPAPGTYSPEKVNLDKSPQYSFGLKTSLKKNNDLPAPGSYHPEKVNLNKSPQYSFGIKTEIHETNSIPGPGEYSPEKAMLLLEKALLFTFGLRTNINKSNDIPAPNVYNIPSTLGGTKEGNKKTAPAYSISGRQKDSTDDRILVPGPGTYEAVKPDSVRIKSPAYSISARYQLPDDHSQIPGPGAHCPEKVILDFPPAHSFGIRHSPYICNLKDAVY